LLCIVHVDEEAESGGIRERARHRENGRYETAHFLLSLALRSSQKAELNQHFPELPVILG
jgi:hypothetical protein